MGTAAEIADSFNENISPKGQKRYVKSKVMKIVMSIIVVLFILILLVYWMFPKSFELDRMYYKKEGDK